MNWTADDVIAYCRRTGQSIPDGLEPEKHSKYHNEPTEVDGIRFDSRHEANRWCELRLLERAGEIKDLQRQVRYELIPKMPGQRATYYYADFVYAENGREVIEDVKGGNATKTAAYRLKKKLMAALGHEIREV